MTESTLPIDYNVYARITSRRALPAEIAEIMAQLDKTTPGWRNATSEVCDVQIPLPAYEITPPLFAEPPAGFEGWAAIFVPIPPYNAQHRCLD